MAQKGGGLTVFLGYLGFAFVLVVGWIAFQSLDQVGLDSHMVQSLIEFDGNWMEGETRACVSYPLSPDNAGILKRKPCSVAYSVTCDVSGKDHVVKIEFWGREI
jgi:hypothetical protein